MRPATVFSSFSPVINPMPSVLDVALRYYLCYNIFILMGKIREAIA